jgi:hypothetical protein
MCLVLMSPTSVRCMQTCAKAQAENKNRNEPEFSFKMILLTWCMAEFGKRCEAQLNWEAILKDTEITADPVSIYTIQQL